MDTDRRDWTNQHGYKVPTETEAIRHLTEQGAATVRNLRSELLLGRFSPGRL